MTLWYLTHYNGCDYYEKTTTPLGIYTTRGLAVEAYRRAKGPEFRGMLVEEMTEAQKQYYPDEYFEIEEVKVDFDWFRPKGKP